MRLWIDRPSTYRRDNPLPHRVEHVPWKTHPVMVWVEMTVPTLEGLHTAIDSCLAPSIGYRHLVGATRYGGLLLLDSPEDPVPLSEMLVLYEDRQIRMWWGQCRPSEPMDLLFRRHRMNDKLPGTLPPLAFDYPDRSIRDNPASGAGANEPGSEPEASLESDSADDNDGQPESSATAAKRGARCVTISTLTAKPGLRLLAKSTGTAKQGPPRVATPTPTRAKVVYTGRSQRTQNLGGLDGADDSSPDFADIFVRNASVDQEPDSEVIPRVAQGIPHSVPLPEGRVLRSSRQISGLVRYQADRKKAPVRAPINSSSKRNRAATTDDEDSEPPAETRQTPRKRVRRNGTPRTGRNTKSGAGNAALVELQGPLRNPSSPVSPPPSAAISQVSTEDIVIELGRSAERLPKDASELRLPALRHLLAPPKIPPRTSWVI